jgi:uncharacterized protein YktB (UPF0637 family)
MSSIKWTEKDFDIFEIPGLEPRMEALIGQVRPKLQQLGEELAPLLSELTGQELFPHVAKHARRTVNPPKDTWVAWANSKRGYKALPHFQVGLWSTHLFAQFAVIYECPTKGEFAGKLETEMDSVLEEIPNTYYWSGDHTKPEVLWQRDMEEADLKQLIHRLKMVNKAEMLCGFQWKRDEAIHLSGQAFLEDVQRKLKTLIPLYKLAM